VCLAEITEKGFAMPVIEEIPEIIKVTTTMIPALQNVKFIRGLIVPLQGTGAMNETRAIESYDNEKRKNQERRTKLKKKHNKQVIKISDAMQCVEDHVFDGRLALAFGKALMNVITGGKVDAGDILWGRISGCMIGKALQQKNLRRRGEFKSDHPFSEKIRIRKGKLHPHVP
jgi:hypothetical protein